ncbi:MAG: glycosyltransferase family 2 protein [Alphaproteobacteria bacterium]|nr:glycosyltransferase family 2 protein [Alphaproteobacteria bacterium]
MKSSLTRVGILILNYNGSKYLKKFIPKVLETDYPNFFVMVADNNSIDDSEDVIKQYPEIFWIKNQSNLGFAAGYNWAVENCPDCEYIVLLNSDIEVTPRWLQPLVDLMQQDTTIGACQSKLLDYQKRDHFEYAGANGGWLDLFGFAFCRGRVLQHCEQDKLQYESSEPIFWACGASICLRKNVFLEQGGFDKFLFAHHEEIDLCWRLQMAGYSIMSCPQSVVYHVGAGTLPRSARKIFFNHRNNLIILWKNLTPLDTLKVLPIRLVLECLIGCIYLMQGKWSFFKAFINAHLSFYSAIIQGKVTVSKHRLPLKKLKGFYSKSILYNSYFKKKNTFEKLLEVKS